jgi:urease accessory protein UreH
MARAAAHAGGGITGGAALLALEATVFGRQAMGESIHDLAFRDRWRVRREGNWFSPTISV